MALQCFDGFTGFAGFYFRQGQIVCISAQIIHLQKELSIELRSNRNRLPVINKRLPAKYFPNETTYTQHFSVEYPPPPLRYSKFRKIINTKLEHKF